jgi:hypothetical protein
MSCTIARALVMHPASEARDSEGGKDAYGVSVDPDEGGLGVLLEGSRDGSHSL